MSFELGISIRAKLPEEGGELLALSTYCRNVTVGFFQGRSGCLQEPLVNKPAEHHWMSHPLSERTCDIQRNIGLAHAEVTRSAT